MAKKKGRYAQKVELGLVPHVYDKSRKGYGQVRPATDDLGTEEPE